MPNPSLAALVTLVQKWSATINLVAKADLPHLWSRHVEDSLALVPHIQPGATHGIDLGSGAGFPGLVLAIETGIPFTLIESDRRKAAFLMEAGRRLGAPVTVIAARIEAARPPPAPLVTARALAPLEKLLGLALPHLAQGGECLFPKGETWETELTAAKRLWQMEATALPGSTSSGRILKVSHLRHAG